MRKDKEVLAAFLKNPNKWLHLRELSRLVKVSAPTAKKEAELLFKKEILEKRNESLLLQYRANIESRSFKKIKIAENIELIEKSGIISFLEKELKAEAIILFGSLAKGENVDSSDIDIFALVAKKLDEAPADLSSFEKKFGREIQLFALSKREFDALKRENPQLCNNIINGRLLFGYLEAF